MGLAVLYRHTRDAFLFAWLVIAWFMAGIRLAAIRQMKYQRRRPEWRLFLCAFLCHFLWRFLWISDFHSIE